MLTVLHGSFQCIILTVCTCIGLDRCPASASSPIVYEFLHRPAQVSERREDIRVRVGVTLAALLLSAVRDSVAVPLAAACEKQKARISNALGCVFAFEHTFTSWFDESVVDQ